MRASVTVRVPGSTSNLGAGFDCVGVAVGRWLPLTALCAELEGHPDNVAAAIYGGATLVLRGPAGLVITPLVLHDALVLVFAIPDFALETERARAVLPQMVPHPQAVAAAAKSAALVHGLAHADARALAAGLDDVLHVPYRRALVPGDDRGPRAAPPAGADGATPPVARPTH